MDKTQAVCLPVDGFLAEKQPENLLQRSEQAAWSVCLH